MSNLIEADLRRLFKSKAFYGICLLAPAVLVLLECLSYVFMKLLGFESTVYADTILPAIEMRYGALIPALFVGCFAGHETVTGCIRNKIISGNSKISCFISSSVTSAVASVIAQASIYFSSEIFGVILGEGLTFDHELLSYTFIRLGASIVLAVFFVALTYFFACNNGAYIAGGALSGAMVIFGLEILTKLYPEDGVIKITGAKLAVYSFIDKYVPFSYFSAPVLREPEIYITGLAGTLILAVSAGVIVYKRKELK